MSELLVEYPCERNVSVPWDLNSGDVVTELLWHYFNDIIHYVAW